jgi:hypothetical protein
MQKLLFFAWLGLVMAWIVVGITLTATKSVLVTAAVVIGGALVLRAVFGLVLRAFPNLRSGASRPHSR